MIGLVLTYALRAGAEQLIVISSTLSLATYLIAMVAAYRLLPLIGRTMAALSFVVCALVFVFSGASILIPLGGGRYRSSLQTCVRSMSAARPLECASHDGRLRSFKLRAGFGCWSALIYPR
jgi:hypothetical protein